jgi:hypothetical protein
MSEVKKDILMIVGINGFPCNAIIVPEKSFHCVVSSVESLQSMYRKTQSEISI